MAVSEEKYQAALARLRRMRQAGTVALMTAVEGVETVGTAGSLSFVDGYFGKAHQGKDPSMPPEHGIFWFGVPYQVFLGTGLHLFGALGLASEHMHALGNGAFCSGVDRMAFHAGINARAKHDAKAPAAGASSSGIRYPLSMTAGRRVYSDAELERIARGHA